MPGQWRLPGGASATAVFQKELMRCIENNPIVLIGPEVIYKNMISINSIEL
jgi:hypothetical protein